MTPPDILLAAVILAFVAWIGWELYRAPVEDFDQSRAEQETRAEEAADSMLHDGTMVARGMRVRFLGLWRARVAADAIPAFIREGATA